MTAPLDKTAKIITESGGEIVSQDDWGRRRLAYKIKGEDFAVYRLFELKLPAEAVKKINDKLNITDEVLRFLLTKVDLRAKALLAEEKARQISREDDNELTDDKE
jgi:small subunit ribosomal protein S6